MRHLLVLGLGMSFLGTFLLGCGDDEAARTSSGVGGRTGENTGGGGESTTRTSTPGGSANVGGTDGTGGTSARCDEDSRGFVHHQDGELATAPLPGAGTRWMLAFASDPNKTYPASMLAHRLVRIDVTRKVTSFPIPNAPVLAPGSLFSEFGDSFCYLVPEDDGSVRLEALDLANTGDALQPVSLVLPSGAGNCECFGWQSAADLVVRCNSNKYAYRPFASVPSEVGPKAIADDIPVANPNHLSSDGQLAVECTSLVHADCAAFDVRRVTPEGTLGEVIYHDTMDYAPEFSPYTTSRFSWIPNTMRLVVASDGKYWRAYGVYDFSPDAHATQVLRTGRMDYGGSTGSHFLGVLDSPKGRYFALRILRENPVETYRFYDFTTGLWADVEGMPTQAQCAQDSTDYEWLDGDTFLTRRCGVFRTITLTEEQFRAGKLSAHAWVDHCSPVEVQYLYYESDRHLLVGRKGKDDTINVENWAFEGNTFASSVVATIPREDQAYDNLSPLALSSEVEGVFLWKEQSLHLIVIDRGRVRTSVDLEKLLGVDYDWTTDSRSLTEYVRSRFESFPPDAVGLVDRDATTRQLRWTFLDSAPLGPTIGIDLPTAEGLWYLSFPPQYLKR